jgi:hypothetical protein
MTPFRKSFATLRSEGFRRQQRVPPSLERVIGSSFLPVNTFLEKSANFSPAPEKWRKTALFQSVAASRGNSPGHRDGPRRHLKWRVDGRIRGCFPRLHGDVERIRRRRRPASPNRPLPSPLCREVPLLAPAKPLSSARFPASAVETLTRHAREGTFAGGVSPRWSRRFTVILRCYGAPPTRNRHDRRSEATGCAATRRTSRRLRSAVDLDESGL